MSLHGDTPAPPASPRPPTLARHGATVPTLPAEMPTQRRRPDETDRKVDAGPATVGAEAREETQAQPPAQAPATPSVRAAMVRLAVKRFWLAGLFVAVTLGLAITGALVGPDAPALRGLAFMGALVCGLASVLLIAAAWTVSTKEDDDYIHWLKEQNSKQRQESGPVADSSAPSAAAGAPAPSAASGSTAATPAVPFEAVILDGSLAPSATVPRPLPAPLVRTLASPTTPTPARTDMADDQMTFRDVSGEVEVTPGWDVFADDDLPRPEAQPIEALQPSRPSAQAAPTESTAAGTAAQAEDAVGADVEPLTAVGPVATVVEVEPVATVGPVATVVEVEPVVTVVEVEPVAEEAQAPTPGGSTEIVIDGTAALPVTTATPDLEGFESLEAAARALGDNLAALKAQQGPLAESLRQSVTAQVDQVWQERLDGVQQTHAEAMAASVSEASERLAAAQAAVERAEGEAREAQREAAEAAATTQTVQARADEQARASAARVEEAENLARRAAEALAVAEAAAATAATDARDAERARIAVAVNALAVSMTAEVAPAERAVVEALGARMIAAVGRLTVDGTAAPVPSTSTSPSPAALLGRLRRS